MPCGSLLEHSPKRGAVASQVAASVYPYILPTCVVQPHGQGRAIASWKQFVASRKEAACHDGNASRASQRAMAGLPSGPWSNWKSTVHRSCAKLFQVFQAHCTHLPLHAFCITARFSLQTPQTAITGKCFAYNGQPGSK